MTDDKQENDVPKPTLVPTPSPLDDIDESMAKLTRGLNQVTDARDETERKGIEIHNRAKQLLIESEDRIAEIDRAVSFEDDLIDRALRGQAELAALIKEHEENRLLLKIERQARLNTTHELRSKNV